ncbi:zinc finger, CCHC-type containing protein [Tanacetum coccineum]
MDSIMGNNTWVLVDLPPGCKPLCCKWIFKRKLKVDGTIEMFKARLVIQGFRQKSGIDYFDTYAPVDITKKFLSSRFFMKDMEEADVILGIRINHGSNGISISQSHYIKKVVSQLEYSRVIGCLMYAMTCIRPDIAFAVGKLSRYTSNPVLEGYTDASWISNTEDNSSTSGWVSMLRGGSISYAFKNQTCITGLTMESEFVALAAAGKEDEWLRNPILEIPLWSKPIEPISILCDGVATLEKAYSQMYNGKSRPLGVWHNMIRELIMNGVVSIEFVRSQEYLVDHLTKGLTKDLVIKSAEGMGLKSN